MTGKLVYFELPARDADRAQRFYEGLFDWSFSTWDGPMDYRMTQAGGDPGGGLYPSEEGQRGPIVYFDSEEIDATVARVRELGGEADDKQPIPGVGWFARCKDTEGNEFSLFQSDQSVQPPG